MSTFDHWHIVDGTLKWLKLITIIPNGLLVSWYILKYHKN